MTTEKLVIPVVNLGILYGQGCILTRTGTTTLSVGPGQMRDSTNTFDIVNPTTLTLDLSLNGVGGLTPNLTVAANTWYAVYILGSKLSALSTQCLAVPESSTPNSVPVPPVLSSADQSYDTFRFVGWVRTDGSAELELFRMVEDGINSRRFYWDNPQVSFSFFNINYAFITTELFGRVAPTSSHMAGYGTTVNNMADTVSSLTPSEVDPGASTDYFMDLPSSGNVQLTLTTWDMPVGRTPEGVLGIGTTASNGSIPTEITITSCTFLI